MPAVSEETLDYLSRREIEATCPEQMPLYEKLLAEGNTPQFAAMLALRKPPGTKGTDRAFLEGGQNQFDAMYAGNREYILNAARQAGIDITGKRFVSGLGKPSNPLAWVSGTGDVLESCRRQGLAAEGSVSYAPPEKEPPAPVPLAEDLIQQEARRRTAADPALAEKVRKNPKAKQELREAIIDRHAYHKK